MCVQDSGERGKESVFRRISPVNWFLTGLGGFLFLGALWFIDSDFTIVAPGVVQHERALPVFAACGGIVSEVRIDEGDPVTKGQVVVRLENAAEEARFLDLKERLASSERALAHAEIAMKEWAIRPGEAPLVTAGERLDWMTSLLEVRRETVALFEEALTQDLVTALRLRQEELLLLEAEGALIEARIRDSWLNAGLLDLSRERSLALLEEARARNVVLREELELLVRKRENLALRAPFAGRVGTLKFRYKGMAVEEGSQVFEVIDEAGPVEVEALVGERNFDLLRVGGEVRLTSRMTGSILGGEFTGRIAELPLSPESEGPDGPRYEVEIAVDEVPFPLVEGSTVEVEFVLGRRTLLEAVLDALSGQNARRRLTRENQSAGGAP